MTHLVDEDGNVYKQPPLSSEWRQQDGLFGTRKDKDWLGRPRIQRNWLGQPEKAQGAWGQPVRSDEGRNLFRPSGGSGPSSSGDAAAAFLGALLIIGLLVLFVYVAGAMLALLGRMLAYLYNGYRTLVERHPGPMRVLHLTIGMSAVAGALHLAGFDLAVVAAGAALVPALWGWLWLTRRLPLVFMPINALLAGACLWLLSYATRAVWQEPWALLTAGLPLVGNLPMVLAALPMLIWLWGLGMVRWRKVFTPLSLLAAGAMLWFILMRIWTEWQPLWAEFSSPLEFLPPVGWLLLLAPLALWLWRLGHARWPVPFTALNLLLFGGLLGLTAYHTEPAWLATWHDWMAGLPFAAMPLLVVSLSPVTLWGWTRLSRRWARVLQIPNLLLTGGILWLIVDRTRSLWQEAWWVIWGDVPVSLDPALCVLVLPLAIWTWRQGSRRLPRYWGIMRCLVLGGILWWIAERTRMLWQSGWWSAAGENALDLALLVGLAPLLLWSWLRLYRRWPKAVAIVSWVMVVPAVTWIVGRLLPDSTYAMRVAIALVPLATRGWLWLLGRRPFLGCLLILLPVAGLGLLALLYPDSLQAVLTPVMSWMVEQGLPIPLQ